MTRRRTIALALSLVAAVLALVASLGAGSSWLTALALAALAGLVVGLQCVAILRTAGLRADVRGGAKRAAARSARVEARIGTVSKDLTSRLGAQVATMSTAVREESAKAGRATVKELRTGAEHDIAQVESLLQLMSLLEPGAVLPRTRGWAASPDVLALLTELVRTERPKLVVDLGSGVSTVVMALACRRFGIEARIIGIDHDPGYAAKTRDVLAAHGLLDLAEVRVAPLAATGLPGHEISWYGLDAFEDLHGIDLLFIDGPPGSTGPQARWPAYPALESRLSPGAVLVLDDSDRPDERLCVQRWVEGGGLDLTWAPLEKGGAVLRRLDPAATPST